MLFDFYIILYEILMYNIITSCLRSISVSKNIGSRIGRNPNSLLDFKSEHLSQYRNLIVGCL